MRVSSLTLPIQLTLRKSALTRSAAAIASVSRPELKVASAVPSSGKDSRYATDFMPPAPGTFCTRIEGAPGSCCGR